MSSASATEARNCENASCPTLRSALPCSRISDRGVQVAATRGSKSSKRAACPSPARLRSTEVSRRSAASAVHRSEEHTSELQSLMRISYAVFCLKKNNRNLHPNRLKLTHKTTCTHTPTQTFRSRPHDRSRSPYPH